MTTLTATSAADDLLADVRLMLARHDGAESLDELRELADELSTALRRVRGRINRLAKRETSEPSQPQPPQSGEVTERPQPAPEPSPPVTPDRQDSTDNVKNQERDTVTQPPQYPPYPQNPPQNPPPPPPPHKAKTRTWLWVLGIVGAFIVGIGVGGATSSDLEPATEKPTGTATPAAADPTEETEPEPDNPAGEVEGFCDYTLNFEEAHTFDASIEAINTGNVDIKMDVWAEFDQLGHKPVRLVKKGVKVSVGETVDVHLTEDATGTQIDRHQSADSNCDLGAEVVDFG